MRDEGLCRIKTILTVDSMSLWSAVAAQVVRVPTEKNLAVHLFWLKELLMTGALTTLRWCDTRDMTADCHTKGSIDRAAILLLMKGIFKFLHAVKDFTALRPKAKYDPRQCGHATGDHPFAHWRQLIFSLYRKYAPHQLQRFEEIMARHSGRESLLYRALLDKYEGNTKSICDNRELPAGTCRVCGVSGHWGNECPSRVRNAGAMKAKLKPAAAEPLWRQSQRRPAQDAWDWSPQSAGRERRRDNDEDGDWHSVPLWLKEEQGGDWNPTPFRIKEESVSKESDEGTPKLRRASAKCQARKRPRPELDQTASEARSVSDAVCSEASRPRSLPSWRERYLPQQSETSKRAAQGSCRVQLARKATFRPAPAPSRRVRCGPHISKAREQSVLSAAI